MKTRTLKNYFNYKLSLRGLAKEKEANMTHQKKDIKISIICPWFYWGDAVGHSANDSYKAFKNLGYEKIKAIGTRCDFKELDFIQCNNYQELKNHQWFIESDLVIYHFAIFHDLFDILRNDKLNGKHIICFHNVTPKHLMPVNTWGIIDKSFEQISVFKNAHGILSDSLENTEELQRHGVNLPYTIELPIAVDRPPIFSLANKPKKRIDLVYIGRFFSSKGLLDLIEAISLVKQNCPINFLLRLTGNTDFSDKAYISEINSKIKLHGLGEHVNFAGKVDNNTLFKIYNDSHIFVTASYHEGFCVPVIESLRAGLVPVTYNAGNLVRIGGGLGRTVETGNIKLLANAIQETIIGISEGLHDNKKCCISTDNGPKTINDLSKDMTNYSLKFNFENYTSKIEAAIDFLFN